VAVETPWDEILVQTKTEKHGSSAKGPWIRYAIKDGNDEWYSTFSKSVADQLVEGEKARIKYETKIVSGRTVKNLLEVAQPEQLPIYSSTDDGETDWDLIGLRKTRCALWSSFLESQLAASLYLKATQTEGRDPHDYVIITGIRYVVAAEKDIFERQAGDDGIPFDFDQGAPE